MIYESSNSYTVTVEPDPNAPFISVVENGGSYSLMLYYKEAIAGDFTISIICTSIDDILGESTSSIDVKVTIISNKIEPVTTEKDDQAEDESPEESSQT